MPGRNESATDPQEACRGAYLSIGKAQGDQRKDSAPAGEAHRRGEEPRPARLQARRRSALPPKKVCGAPPAGGARKKGKDVTEILLANTSGVPQLEDLLEQVTDGGRRQDVGREDAQSGEAASRKASSVLAILNQEHQQRLHKWVALQHRAVARGWKVDGAQATTAAGEGPSAGTAVVTPTHIGTAPMRGAGTAVDVSPRGSPGRLTAIWLDAATPGGILLMSAYLWNREGMTPRNVAILEAAIAEARAFGGPWLLGGDFNVDPDLICGNIEWLARANVAVLAPATHTHFPGKGDSRTLDFFLVDRRLLPCVVDVAVADDLRLAPHRVVRLRWRLKAARYLVEALKTPRAFPQQRPIGCGRKPPVVNMSADIEGLGGEEVTRIIGDKWSEIALAVEHELCGVCDLVDAQGNPLNAYCGRGGGLRLSKRQVLPPRTVRAFGRLDPVSRGFLLVSARIRELQALKAACRAAGGPPAASLRQWRFIADKLKRGNGPIGIIIKEKPVPWAARLEAIAEAKLLDDDRRTDSEHHLDWTQLDSWAEEAEALAESGRRRMANAARASWKAFGDEQRKQGDRGAHRFSKRAELPAGASVVSDGRRSASPQDIVKADRDEWYGVWMRHASTATAPWRTADPSMLQAITPITGQRIEECALTFSDHTGLGVDNMPPRKLSWLSRDTANAIAAFLMLAEAAGRWPTAVATILMHLIPKKEAGRRAIGILATIVRIWERVRRPLVWEWRARNERPYNFAAKGRTSEEAVWRQSVCDAAAASLGLESMAVLLDLVKAFEMVPLCVVWVKALRKGFPATVLRLTLEAYSAARRLVFAGAISDEVRTLSAILAGGGFATDLLYVIMIDIIDDALLLHPTVSLCLYVDDISAHASGPIDGTASALAQCTRYLIGQFEEETGLTVSRGKPWRPGGKTIATASSKAAATAIATSMRALGIRTTADAMHLGVPYAPARRVRSAAIAAKWKKAKDRQKVIGQLGTKLARRVQRSGVLATLTHGTSVRGCPQHRVRSAQRMAAAAGRPIKGRSIIARLAVSRDDPAIALTVAPIVKWAEAVWNGTVGELVLQAAWRRAAPIIASAKRGDMAVTDPSGACIASAARIGWRMLSFATVLTQGGEVLDFRAVCPKSVRLHAEEALEEAQAVESSIAKENCWRLRPRQRALLNERTAATEAALRGGQARRASGLGVVKLAASVVHSIAIDPQGRVRNRGTEDMDYDPLLHEKGLVPWFTPAAAVVNAKGKAALSDAAAGSVAALVDGGWWTQERLFAAGEAASPHCAACNQGIGTLWHRVGTCSCSKALRDSAACTSMLKYGATHLSDPLFLQGVPAKPHPPDPPPLIERSAIEGVDGSEGTGDAIYTGEAYTDGALKALGPRRFWRGGWAAVVVDGKGKVTHGVWGTCPDAYPSSLRAELWAVMQLLLKALPPLRVHVDCAEVLRGISRGPAWCTDGAREGADLWRRIWHSLLQMGGGVTFRKVKAHTTEAHVQSGLITAVQRRGNEHADRLAKFGAAEAERRSPTKAVRRAYFRAVSYYKWIATLAAQWPADTEAIPRTRGRRGQQGQGQKGQEETAAAVDAAATFREDDPRDTTGEGDSAQLASSEDKAAWAVHARSPHELWAEGGRLRCKACGRNALGQARAAMARAACPGTLVERMGGEEGIQGSSAETALRSRGWAPAPTRRPAAKRPACTSIDGGDQNKATKIRKVSSEVLETNLVAEAYGECEDPHPEMCIDQHVMDDLHLEPHLLFDPLCPHAHEVEEDVFGFGALGMDDDGNDEVHETASRGRNTDGGQKRATGSATCSGVDAARAAAFDGAGMSSGASGSADAACAQAGAAEDRGGSEDNGRVVRRRLCKKTAPEEANGYSELAAPAAPRAERDAPPAGPRRRGADGIPTADAARRGGQSQQLGAKWGAGHRLSATNGIVWCRRCGHFSAERVRALAAACRGEAVGVYASRRQRLLEGRHPVTGQLLGA